MAKLVANVTFCDVDGNTVSEKYNYRFGGDLYDLLDYFNFWLTDKDNFSKTNNPVHPGLNGIIDISKPISIAISQEE